MLTAMRIPALAALAATLALLVPAAALAGNPGQAQARKDAVAFFAAASQGNWTQVCADYSAAARKSLPKKVTCEVLWAKGYGPTFKGATIKITAVHALGPIALVNLTARKAHGKLVKVNVIFRLENGRYLYQTHRDTSHKMTQKPGPKHAKK